MAGRNPKVGIITANFNGKKLIKGCLDSLFKIDYPKDRFEVIVVDNGSTDGSVQFIKDKYKKVKVIKNEINNYCRGCNLGILKSKADYIVLLNNDVIVKKNWLPELVKVIESDSSIGAVTGKLLNKDGTIQNAGLYELPNFYWDERGAGKKAKEKEYNCIAEVDAISGACVLYRRSALKQVGLLDEDFVMFGEDVDISLRLKKKGWKLVYVPSSVAYHKKHGSCDEHFAREAIEKNRLLLVAKHYPHKLSNALTGNDYFIVKDDKYNSGRFFTLLPEIFLKVKKHNWSAANGIIKEAFAELKKILNYENKKLEGIILGKDRYLEELTRQVSSIQNDLELYKRQVSSIQNDLELYKEEVFNLSEKLKQSLDKNLEKDHNIEEFTRQINSLQNDLQLHREEILNLSEKLKQSLDKGLEKDNIILDKNKQLEEVSHKLNEAEKELSGIYNSEGFRYILNPLWKIIWHLRFILKKLINKASGFIWLPAIISLSPLILLQVLLSIFEHIAELLFGKLAAYFKKEREIIPFDKLKVSVVIPNWNGIELLKKCLSSIYETDIFKGNGYEVLVVDDSSDYNIAECIKDDFPQVRVIRNNHNCGFGRTCNRGVKEAKGELIVLLNNDIMVSQGFLEPLKAHFKDPQVFAVAPKLYGWDKKTFNYGMHMGRFEGGYLSLWNESETGNGDKVSQAAPTIFAVGGTVCFRKRDFLWLGGFDDIYRPNCWEDIDISYRAQKRGLKVLYEPKSLVYHKAAATLNYARHKEIKNELLFMWKNLTDMRMLLAHFNRLPEFFYYGRDGSRAAFLTGYLWALRYFASALIHRFQEAKYLKVSDMRILNRCILYYRNFMRSGFIHSDKRTVLLIAPFIIYPLNSGGKLRIYNLYKRLSKKYNLILLSLIHHEKEREYIHPLKGLFKEIYVVHTKTPSQNSLFPGRYKYSFSSFLIEKLKDIQKKTPIDLIHIESNEMLYLTEYIKYIPVVYTEHDISILSYTKSYYKKGMSGSLFDFFDYLKVVSHHDACYRKIDRVVALSKEDVKVIKAFWPGSDCSLIPTGVDLGHFTFQEKSGRNKSLIFVGHYQHYPNEEAALYFCRYIFPIIRKNMPQVTLKLIGSAPTEKIVKLSELEAVQVIGEVADVNPYLQEASVFVCPFKRSAGIKGKVLEAMATGTPVVSTTRGAYGIDAQDGSSILIADKPDDFAGSVIELLRNDDLYRKLARNARALVEKNYDWEKIVKQLDRLYSEVMDDGKVPSKRAFISQDEERATPKEPAGKDNFPDEISLLGIIKETDRIIEASLNNLDKDDGAGADLNPEELHIELTHSCNSSCITCDIWDYQQRNKKSIHDELKLDEIKKFIDKSERLKDIKTIVLSGGEPFLRKDLIEICRYLIKKFPHSHLGILTNGADTENIITTTKQILDRYRPEYFWLGSSLDGIGDTHDRIRGKSGVFSSLEKTIQACKRQGLNITLTFTITTQNFGQLLTAKKFADGYGLELYIQFAVPKDVREKGVFKFTPGQLTDIEAGINQIILEELGGKDPGKLIHALKEESFRGLVAKLYYLSHLVSYQRNPVRYFKRCIAGRRFAMLSPYGDLYFCPGLKNGAIGNIREEDFDNLWISNKAGNIREFISKELCHCWLVCIVFPALDQIREAAKMPRKKNLGNSLIAAQGLSLPSKSKLLLEENSNLNQREYEEGKVVLESLPAGIGIGAHGRCNADCIFCLGGYPKLFDLNTYKQFFEKRLARVLSKAEFVNLCGFGELLLMPRCEEFLEYLNQTLPFTNKIITTNGIPLSEALIKKFTEGRYSLQISLHSSKKELHRVLTRTEAFDRIVNQIQHIISSRRGGRSASVNMVFLINTLNIENLPEFVEFSAKLGADSVIANYMTVYTPAHLKLSCFFKQKITNQIFCQAEEKAAKLGLSLSLPPKFGTNGSPRLRCPEPWKYLYVETEGSILPCCYAGSHIGYLYRDDFAQIWNSNFYKDLRKSLVEGRDNGSCRYCYKNKAANVNDIRSHVSFRPDLQDKILKGISLK